MGLRTEVWRWVEQASMPSTRGSGRGWRPRRGRGRRCGVALREWTVAPLRLKTSWPRAWRERVGAGEWRGRRCGGEEDDEGEEEKGGKGEEGKRRGGEKGTWVSRDWLHQRGGSAGVVRNGFQTPRLNPFGQNDAWRDGPRGENLSNRRGGRGGSGIVCSRRSHAQREPGAGDL